MKSWSALCLSVLTVGCTAARDPGAGQNAGLAAAPVVIDFQTGFTGNWIQLNIAGDRIFSGALTTDNRIGLAGRLHHVVTTVDALAVTVIVDRSHSFPFRIDLDRGRHIGLSRDLDDHSVHLAQSREAFQYD